MKTREIINKNNDTVKFANHFNTNSSIKNLLKKVPNAKGISVLFKNTKYGNEILGYSNINEQFDIVLSDVFNAYTAKVLAWRATGDNRPLSSRVELFRDLVFDRVREAPEIGGTLGDFMKSATGKEISKVLKNAGIKEDEDLYINIIIMIAVRTFIINTMTEPEVVEAEIVIENAGHNAFSTKKTEEEVHEIVVVDKEVPKMSKEVQKIMEMISEMNATVSDDEIKRFVSIVKPFVPDVLDALYKRIDKCVMTNELWTGNIAQRIVRDLKHSENLDERMKGLLAYVAGMKCDGGEVVIRNLFFVVIDLINHSTDDEHLYQDAKFIIRLMKSDDNMNNFLEEMVGQGGRINDIINEFNGFRDDVPVVVEQTKTKLPTPVEAEDATKKIEKKVDTNNTDQPSPTNDNTLKLDLSVFSTLSKFIRFTQN